MRGLLVFLVVCVAVATANPLLKKSINAKAIESVDQSLDALRSHEAAGHNFDRTKKDVTFCVEVRQDNKPVVVDCSNRQPVYSAPAPPPPPPPPPAPEPEPLPEPQPQPIPTHTHTLNIEVPCEPEMAAYVVQPPQEVVYAPTGNCVPQIPNIVHVPTAPAGVPTQVYHLPAHHGLHGLHAYSNLHGGHGLHHAVKPLHQQVVPAAATTVPCAVHQLNHGVHQLNGGLHQLNSGVQCTCQSTPGQLVATGKSAGAAAAPAPGMDNEALARKFLADLQKNAGGQVMMMPGSAPASSMQSRYMPMRPTLNMPPPQVTFQQQPMSGAAVYPMGMGQQAMYNGAMHMKALEDSFTGGRMIPAIRAYRDDGEEAAANAAAAAAAAAIPTGDAKVAENPSAVPKQSPSEIVEQMKKNDKDDSKNPRVARFVMEKDEAENRLEEN